MVQEVAVCLDSCGFPLKEALCLAAAGTQRSELSPLVCAVHQGIPSLSRPGYPAAAASSAPGVGTGVALTVTA